MKKKTEKEILEDELLFLANGKIEDMKTFIDELKNNFYDLEELNEIKEQW